MSENSLADSQRPLEAPDAEEQPKGCEGVKSSVDGSCVECRSFEVVYRHEEPEQASKDPLFCVACETVQCDGFRRPELRYLHGDDMGHAERKFRQAHTREILQGIIHIVAVGPVIGYHVHDSHGEKLSA